MTHGGIWILGMILLSSVALAVERRRSELATARFDLRDRQVPMSLLSFALDRVGEAAFLVDEDARFQFVNQASCRVLEYTQDELLQMGTSDVDPDFPTERWSEHWQQLLDAGMSYLPKPFSIRRLSKIVRSCLDELEECQG